MGRRKAFWASFVLAIGVFVGCSDDGGPSPDLVQPILPVPELRLEVESLSFRVVRGGEDPEPARIALSNVAPGAAPAPVSVAGVDYGPEASFWLQAALTSGSTPATLVAQPRITILPTGITTATIQLVSPGFDGVGVSLPVTIEVLAPLERLGLAEAPAGAISGKRLEVQPVVTLIDDEGALASWASELVTVSVASGSGRLLGTLTVEAVDGVATFTDLQIDGAGEHTLQFMSGALVGVVSDTLTVLQEVAALGITRQPVGGSSLGPLPTQPAVELLDHAGLRVMTGSGATAEVTASVASGPGVLSGRVVVDAVAGVATFEDLTLSQGGTYTLRFRVTRPLATPPVEGISASLTVESVTPRVTSVDVVLSQSSVTGNTAQQAQVRVLDQVGNTMNVPVNWEVTAPLVARVTPQGMVSSLGTGVTQIRAEADGVVGEASLSVSFPVSAFTISLEYVTPVSASLQAAFQAAAARWAQSFRGDLSAVQVTDLDVAFCSGVEGTRLTGVIDDLLILVKVDSIDGVGGTLGSAGPCFIRNSTGSPVIGTIRMDRDDLAFLAGLGLLNDVILHEMGHVLGLGTLWGVVDPSGIEEEPACLLEDPIQPGGGARWIFPLLVPDYAGRSVPLENCGGGGTRNGHWRESVLGRELMTGFLSLSGNPLSPLSLAGLLDLNVGYQVDLATHDVQPWTVLQPQIGGILSGIHLHDSGAALPQPRKIDGQGRVIP